MTETVTNIQIVVTIVTAILGSSLLTTVFTKLFDYFTATKKTYQILLLAALEQLCDKILAQGYRTQMQTLRLKEIQDQYRKIKGDGYADALVADAMAMPLREHRKEAA